MKSASPHHAYRRDSLLLLFGVGLLFFFKLGAAPLANPDEGRYAEIAREMLATGNWVVPQLNGMPYFEKPPLMYWAVAACIKGLGPGEWALRLMPALFGLGGVWLTYASMRRLYDRRAGLMSAIVLATGVLYFAHARLLLLDMAVSVLMSATLFCFILAMEEPPGRRRRGLFYGLYASAALATLTKGAIGVLVPGAIMFLWLLLFDGWKRLRPLYLPTGASLFLAIALPWHLLIARRHDGWAHFYFIHEHWERFTTTEHRRYEPWWFFIPIILLGLFPWTGFLWPAVCDAVAGGWARRRENATSWFLLTWAGFVFLFFSKSQSKLIPYILAVFPPLAGVIGVWLTRCLAEGAIGRLRSGLRFFFVVGLLMAAALVVVVTKPGILREAGQADALRPYAWLLAGILVVGGAGTLRAVSRCGARAGLVAMLVTMLAFYAVLIPARPYIQKPGTKDIAGVVKAAAGPRDRIYHYRGFFHDFTYYTGREVGLVEATDELEVQFLRPEERAARFIDEAELRREWAGPGRIWLIGRRSALQPLMNDPSFRYRVAAESRGHCLLTNRPAIPGP
jgi:4-amino-4-deoxy-L-arabinose transferase-like glycosyltransferase